MIKTENLFKYLFFSALAVYQLLGLVSVVARVMLVVILVLAIVCMGKSFVYIQRSVINGLFLLLFLNTLYYLISPKIIEGTSNWETTGFFANTGMNLSVFFISYYFAINKKIELKEMQFLFIIIFILTSIRFFITKDFILMEYGRMRTMNMAYDFVIFMPYLLLFRHKLVPVVFLLPTLYYVMYGGKRGAILIYSLSAVFIVYNYYFRNVKGHVIRNLIIISALCYVGLTIATDVFQQSELLQHRLEQTSKGDLNGRGSIFGNIFEAWANGGFLQLLLGFGFCSSVRFSGNYAHSDWLELLSTAGLLGVTIYLILFIQMYMFSKRQCYIDRDRKILFLILFIWLLKSFFSMSYCDVGSMPMTFLCGYVVGNNQTAIKSYFYK